MKRALLVLLITLTCAPALAQSQNSIPAGNLDLAPGSVPSYGQFVWFTWWTSRTGTWKRPIIQIYCEQPSTGAITYSSAAYADWQERADTHFQLVPTGPVDYRQTTICFASLVVRKKDGPLWEGPFYTVAQIYFYLR